MVEKEDIKKEDGLEDCKPCSGTGRIFGCFCGHCGGSGKVKVRPKSETEKPRRIGWDCA